MNTNIPVEERAHALRELLRADPEAALLAIKNPKIAGPVQNYTYESVRLDARGHRAVGAKDEGRGWFPLDFSAQSDRRRPPKNASREDVIAFADMFARENGWILFDGDAP